MGGKLKCVPGEGERPARGRHRGLKREASGKGAASMAQLHTHAHGHAEGDHAHGHGHDHAGHTHEHGKGGMECCTHHNIKIERYVLLYLIGGMLVLSTVVANLFFSLSIPEEIARIPA